jgi:hypothetical protein
LNCLICQKRKAKRACPAKAQTICSVCCGTEREVTIDCPSDCPYLVASRQYAIQHRDFDVAKLPFPESKIPSSFVVAHEELLLALSYGISAFTRDNRPLVDSDVLASLRALAEAYRTLSSGLYYERPPEYLLQRQLYDAIKKAIEDYKQAEAQRVGLSSTRDGEIRDTLVFLTQLGAMRANGRPKGRAFIDFLKSQFKSEAFSNPASSILYVP